MMANTKKPVHSTRSARSASNKASNELWVKGKTPGYLALAGGSGDARMRKRVQTQAQNRVTPEEAAKSKKGTVTKRPAGPKGGQGAALDKRRLEDPAKKRGEKLPSYYAGMWRQEEARKAKEKLKKPLAKKGK